MMINDMYMFFHIAGPCKFSNNTQHAISKIDLEELKEEKIFSVISKWLSRYDIVFAIIDGIKSAHKMDFTLLALSPSPRRKNASMKRSATTVTDMPMQTNNASLTDIELSETRSGTD